MHNYGVQLDFSRKVATLRTNGVKYDIALDVRPVVDDEPLPNTPLSNALCEVSYKQFKELCKDENT